MRYRTARWRWRLLDAGGARTGFLAARCSPDLAEGYALPISELEELLDQDIVYVGGGSTANLLAVWRLHGLPALLEKAAAGGTILAGISAGANCWYEASSTDSFSPTAPLPDGLRFLPGSFCPHYLGEEDRRETYVRFVGSGALPAGYAADDGVALLWRDGELVEVISERPDGVAYAVGPDGDPARRAGARLGHVEQGVRRDVAEPEEGGRPHLDAAHRQVARAVATEADGRPLRDTGRRGELLLESYDGAGARMVTVNNDPAISCPNANWNGATTNYCSGVTSDDIVAHEWGHAYTEHTSGLIYQWQPGALNEAYSDMWGNTVDILNTRENTTDDVRRTEGQCSTSTPGRVSFEITAPAEIAGPCNVAAASWTDMSAFTTPVSANIVVGLDSDRDGSATNGCDAYTNAADVAGKWAYVDRAAPARSR